MIKYKLGQKNEIRIIGRTLRRDDLALFWTGSGMEFCFDGKQVWIDIESDYTSHEDWIRVEVNGCTVERMMIPKDIIKYACSGDWRMELVEKSVSIKKYNL